MGSLKMVPSAVHGAFSLTESWSNINNNILCFQYNILI